MKPVQYFSRAYLENCKKMKPHQILRFLDDFARLHASSKPVKSRLISMKVPEDLLKAFKAKAQLRNIPYQSQIKTLMKEWLNPRIRR